jgi:hypothetical protein
MSPWPLELGATKPGSKVNRFTSSVFTNPFRRRNYAGKKTRKRFLDYVFYKKSLVTPAQVLFAYPDFGNFHFFWYFFFSLFGRIHKILDFFSQFHAPKSSVSSLFQKIYDSKKSEKKRENGVPDPPPVYY